MNRKDRIQEMSFNFSRLHDEAYYNIFNMIPEFSLNHLHYAIQTDSNCYSLSSFKINEWT